MAYLRDLCLLAYSGVQHLLCCVFVLFFSTLYTLCCQLFGLSILYCLFGILYLLYATAMLQMTARC
jgi:hypothetical protein